jgi:TonB-dependent receptor
VGDPRPLVLNDTSSTQSYNELLPAFNLKIMPFENFDIRLSATRTLSRPNFRWLVPYTVIALGARSSISRGAPNLKHVTAQNYDAYLTYYSSDIGLISFGGFYKKLKNISYLLNSQVVDVEHADTLGIPTQYAGLSLNEPVNSDEGTVYGFEVEGQLTMNFLPGFLRNFILNFNYSRIYSETELPYFFVEKEIIPSFPEPEVYLTPVYLTRKSRIPGQSDHLANVTLGYETGGFSARLSVQYQGESIARVSTAEAGDHSYNDDYLRWDISAKQDITKNIALYLNFINLTGREEGAYYYIPEKTTSEEFFGMMIDFGAQYTFN